VDIAFTRAKVAVLIDGCFWHGCPEHHQAPKTNAAFWLTKLAGNVVRDHETTQMLTDAGWRVLRFWEHVSVEEVATAIEAAVLKARTQTCD
jgi:DNA mismatch endonuclease (patch repair protein)